MAQLSGRSTGYPEADRYRFDDARASLRERQDMALTTTDREPAVIIDWFDVYSGWLRMFTPRPSQPPVVTAVREDGNLTGEQRTALEELYVAFSEVTRIHRQQ